MASSHDLPSIRTAYAHARAVQHTLSQTAWPEFSDATILAEIAAGHLFKVMLGQALAGIFSVAYEDGAIWGDLEHGEHIYLHRIARAAAGTGGGLFVAVLAWAQAQCRSSSRVGVRMDTWASNHALIAFYERHGFRVVGHRRIGHEPRLPAHYHENDFALLENALPAPTIPSGHVAPPVNP